MKQSVVTVILTTAWIGFSEFIRNQILFLSYWQEHYTKLGITFPSNPINGVVWIFWSLLFALLIFVISKQYSLRDLAIISWVAGFLMMWLVIGNLGVLPYKLLWFAIPLSLLESFVAAWIVKKSINK